MTERYCLIGSPIDHSPSPAMQNAGFAALKRDAEYVLRPCGPDAVGEVWNALRHGTLTGCNVTTPLKSQAADAFPGSPRVERSHSANTVYHEGTRLRVESTDVDGVRAPLERRQVSGGDALLLGAGGAARAAMLALEELGVCVHVAARDPGKAALALEEVGPRPRGRALALNDLSRDRGLLKSLAVVLQATPLGRSGEELALPWEQISGDCVAFEMLYASTPFVARASQRGMRVIPGWEMLLEQGLCSFELWTGSAAPREAMEHGLKEALGLA
ncbi:MAG: hypothetical protein AAF658_00270 [Myxococcota bacterium]